MGNQGTTNWKLTAFFAISLMLIAGLFSTAAIAANGDGEITVGWSATEADTAVTADDGTTDPLAAGSRGNTLLFTYTVPTTISMAGGQLTIDIPDGWAIVKKANDAATMFDEASLFDEVVIAVDGTEVYSTAATTDSIADVDGAAGPAPAITDTDALAALTIGDPIKVTLGSDWFDGGTITIRLGNVQTAIPSSLRVVGPPPHTAYMFEARSMERDGRLVRLRPSTDNPQPQPRVRVGNILGLRTADADADNTTADLTKRVVGIEPATSYPGEKYNYIATFTAPGPMYGATLVVNFPADGDTGLTTEGDDRFTVRAPGASIAFDPDSDVSGRAVTVNLTRINKDQKVTVTLHDATVGTGVTATDAGGTAFGAITTTVGTNADIAATKITGGAFALVPGSGKIVASPDSVNAKASISRLTITYTAATSLDRAQLRITIPEGIMASAKTGEADVDSSGDGVLEPTFRLQGTNSNMRGFVTSPDSKGAAPVIEHTATNLEQGTPTTITWNAVTLAKDKTFRTYINGVKVQDEGARLMITAQLIAADDSFAADTALVNADGARFYVVVTENEDVTFTADKDRLRAASLDRVTFTFTAVDTPIRNGRVQFNIPSGWTAPAKGSASDADVIGKVETSLRWKEDLSVSGRSITVAIPNLDKGEMVTVTYGARGKMAMVQRNAAEAVKINGYYWASSSSPRRGAGTVTIMVDNAKDGTGKGSITPTTVRAGSIEETFTIRYVADGTMDGGQVSLERPAGWGDFSSDPAQLNYVRVTSSGGATITERDNGNSIYIVTLGKCPPNGTITFVYGTGTGARRGAKAQNNVDVANFMLKSQGDEFGTLSGVMGDRKQEAVKADNPKYLGETFTDFPGLLKVDVTGADDGSGTAEVTLVKSKAGDQNYDAYNPRVAGTAEMRVHANDDATYIKVVYTATETIENGMLKFTAPAGWTKPQGSDPGEPGFTSVQGTGGASIDPESYATAATDLSLTVPITLINAGDTIEIHYGETAGSGGGAMAPAASGRYRFTVDVKGGDSDDNAFRAITGTADGDPLEIMVYGQASGGGSAAVTMGADGITAGGSAQVTVTYTAAGDVTGGMLQLTTPANWSLPMMSNVTITSTGSIGAASAGDFGGYYVGDPDDDADDKTVPTGGPSKMQVHVDSVNLDAGETVTFVYSAAMVQPATGDATFAVAVDGGAGPGTGAMAVSAPEDGTLTVTVGEAAAGSGMAAVDLMGMAITANSEANELTFNYTAAGTIGYPREFRVTIPAGWSEPNSGVDNKKGTYTVALADKDGRTRANVVEALAPVGMDLVTRVRAGSATVNAGDVVSITYTNADAPTTVGNSAFKVLFDGMQVGDDLNVLVGSGKPVTALMVTAPAMRLAESTDPSMITVMLTDEDGNEAPAESDTVVSLNSSPGGSFTVDGTAVTTVTITAGTSSAMVDYSNSSLGDAMITASSGTLMDGTATIMVSTEDVMIDSVTFTIADSDGLAKTVARDGDTVTVTAEATRGQTAMVTIGTIIANGPMDESTTRPGTYTRSHTLAAGSPEGDHPVSVSIGDMSHAAGSITVDNTAPTVSNASASPDTVENGDTVTISASVSGATSVTASVALLDIGAASVTLTDADGDGTYTGMHMISADNTATNGEHIITITAMDAAGNSNDDTATVTLKNAISFTSTLPQGISLFSVPLDEEGLDTVGQLEAKLGDNVNLLITYDGTSWNSRSSNVAITGSLGILVSMSAETPVTFEGQPWSDTTITLARGNNLIGLPVNDANITNISDIAGQFATGVVTNVIASSGGEFQLVAAAGDPADGPVAGDAAYLVMASGPGTATLSGPGWMTDAVSGAPIALSGYTVDSQTPALNVHGSVVDEITGLAKQGFRVKVKNLSTKSALSHITDEAADGYDMTFVDLAESYAARVGDVLEITADSPDPLIGVQPVRHIVTVDDVKNSRITLEDLIAYEIPAETELLRNYPNPFNPETWIPYHLSEDADVSLTIYDVNGALVRDIDVGHQTAAKYDTRSKAIYWDGRNQFGEQVASGIYFYSLNAGDFSATRKMVILK